MEDNSPIESSARSNALPVLFVASRSVDDAATWLQAERKTVDIALRDHGAVLLRGFSVNGPKFAQLNRQMCGRAEPYLYRSTPRTAVGSNIYTATEYPAKLTIPMHCENAYQRSWPMKLLFWCDVPASAGGETPLADVVRVTARIPREILDEFSARRVLYVRNYSESIDLPWQTVFQTQDRAAVEQFCRSAEIEFEWNANGGLRTRQVCQGLAKHPSTGAIVWFNQAQLFHISSLSDADRSSMASIFREEDLPRNAYFGDGAAIAPEMLAVVRRAFDAERLTFRWQAGDVLIVDNMRVAHGRNPYSGRRRILVGMGDVHRPSERR